MTADPPARTLLPADRLPVDAEATLGTDGALLVEGSTVGAVRHV